MNRLVHQILRVGAAAAAVLWLGALPAGALEKEDRRPPVILVLPTAGAGVPDPLHVRAQVHDPSGVSEITLWAKGEADTEYHGFAMQRVSEGIYEGVVPASPERGTRVAFYVEAVDAVGNGPSRGGSPTSPFGVRLASSAAALPAAPAAAPTAKGLGLGPILAAGAMLLALVVLGLLFYRRWQAKGDDVFWERILQVLDGAEREQIGPIVDGICSRSHDHPRRGPLRLEPDDVLLRLADRRLGRSPLLPRLLRESREITLRNHIDPAERLQALADDAFFLQLVGPLVQAGSELQEAALREIADRPHAHPTRGIVMTDVPTLKSRIEWARGVDAHVVLERWDREQRGRKHGSRAAASPRPISPATVGLESSSGMTQLELLIALAIVAIAVGMASVNLKPLEAPVRTSGVLIESLVKQVRARALATTTPHRIRPFTESVLVVETAATCDSEAWSLESRMTLDLPPEVTLAETEWSICFGTRGHASESVMLTLDHPQFESGRLEVLMGGATRWNP